VNFDGNLLFVKTLKEFNTRLFNY